MYQCGKNIEYISIIGRDMMIRMRFYLRKKHAAAGIRIFIGRKNMRSAARLALAADELIFV